MSSAQKTEQTAAHREVNEVVMRAMSVLTQPERQCVASHRPLSIFITRLSEAAQTADPKAMRNVIQEMKRARISPAQIAERYVPLVARGFGDAWLSDQCDFATVTLASARLQSMLWQLEADAIPKPWSGQGRPPFLVGVCEGAQHTLGACVLAGALRHRGATVVLDLELTPHCLARHVLNQQLCGVLLSAARHDDLASLRELVDVSHQKGRSTPVVIGGSILATAPDIQLQTGADFVSQSVDEVLAFCDPLHVAQDDTFALEKDVK
ncbi:MAG: cobalamin B12-binding domain-containing protein [Pseudomonadota bacterium]